jgi:hypothetical protein
MPDAILWRLMAGKLRQIKLLSFAAAYFWMQKLPQFPPKHQTFPEAFIGIELVHHPLRELLTGGQIAPPHKRRNF